LVGFLTGIAALALSGGAFAQQCEPQRAAEKFPDYAGRVVRVAAAPTTPPFTFSDPADLNRMIGIEAEIIEGAMQCAGLRFEYVRGPWPSLLATIFSGATDVMAGNVVYRPDRAERADFILWYINGQSFLVRRGNPSNIRRPEDLCGKTGTSVIGGAGALETERQSRACVERGQPAINFVPAADQEAAARQLANGRADFMSDGAANAAARLASGAGRELAIGFSIRTELAAGFAVRNGNETMARIVYDGLRVMEADGRLRALMDKYGLSPDLLMPIEIRR
jgi:polar amino acid transport system substrate-binding protein